MTNVTKMNAEAKIEMTQDVPVVGNYDVVVCGGGPAGFIAATASAREGARTAIIEQYGFFGGMATAGFVNPISVFTSLRAMNILTRHVSRTVSQEARILSTYMWRTERNRT